MNPNDQKNLAFFDWNFFKTGRLLKNITGIRESVKSPKTMLFI